MIILLKRFLALDVLDRAALVETDAELAAAWHIQQQGGVQPPTPAGYRPCQDCHTPAPVRVLAATLGHRCPTCRDAHNAAIRARHTAAPIIAQPETISVFSADQFERVAA